MSLRCPVADFEAREAARRAKIDEVAPRGAKSRGIKIGDGTASGRVLLVDKI